MSGFNSNEIVISDPQSGNTAGINDDGQLHVVMEGKVDQANSSSTPLGANETFTGTSVETLPFAVIVVSVYSDVSSDTKGFCLQFSQDDINWYDAECYTIAADTSKTFSFQPEAKYYRAKYKNGATPQSEFRLQVTLKKSYVKPSSHAIDDAISDNDDAELSKAVITAKDVDTGEFINIGSRQGDTGFNLNVSVDQTEPTTNSIKTMEYDHSEIHDGRHYIITHVDPDLDAAATIEYLIITPDTTRWSHLTFEISGIVSTDVSFYEGTGLTGGTPVEAINNNRNSANASVNTITLNPTGGSGDGSLIYNQIFGGPSSNQFRGSTSFAAERLEFVLKQNEAYLLRVTSGVDNNRVSLKLSWYEHVNKN